MSASPGMRNLPVASRIRAPRGIVVELDGPRVAIRWSAVSNVISGCGGEPVASITVTWVIAKTGLRGLEQEQSRETMVTAESARFKRRPPEIPGNDHALQSLRMWFGPIVMARGGCISSALRGACRAAV